MTSQQIREAVEQAQKPLVERVDKIAGQRTLALLTAALSLIVAIAAILYGINREDALQKQLSTNSIVVCASAKSTALAPRKEPLAGESRNRYLNRLESQRELLLAVGGLHCPSLRGFATFSVLRARALLEIEAILQRLAPGKLRAILGGEQIGEESTPDASVTATVPGSTDTAGGGDTAAGPKQPGAGAGGGTGDGADPDPGPQKPDPPPVAEPDPPPPPVTSTPASEPPPESNPEPEPEEPQSKPGLLDPALGIVCEITQGVRLCTPR